MSEVLCFDVYGSTHDQHSITDTLEAVTGLPSPIVQEMSEMWVEHQISYSMEVTLMEDYRSWWDLTTESLDYVLNYYSVDLSDEEYQQVMNAYKHLEPYENLANFGQLRDAGHELYILSDGNQEMLNELATNTGFDDYLSDIVSVEDVEVFKPHPKAYGNIENYTDRSLEDCTMVATHTFDIAGAQAAGMKTILVNRFNVPATRLNHTPDMVVDSYAELADKLSEE